MQYDQSGLSSGGDNRRLSLPHPLVISKRKRSHIAYLRAICASAGGSAIAVKLEPLGLQPLAVDPVPAPTVAAPLAPLTTHTHNQLAHETTTSKIGSPQL